MAVFSVVHSLQRVFAPSPSPFSNNTLFLGSPLLKNLHACMYVCMDGWMDGWMDGCIYVRFI